MSPALLALLPSLIELAIKYGPTAATQIINLVHKDNPTLEDWNAAFDFSESNAKKFLAEKPE